MGNKTAKTTAIWTELSPDNLVQQIAGWCPQLAGMLTGTHPDFVSLYVKQRGDYDFIAVCKRYSTDGGLEVVFGNGASIGTALRGIEGSIAASRWKEDKPWDASKGNGK